MSIDTPKLDELQRQVLELQSAILIKNQALQNCEGMIDEIRDYPVTYDSVIEALYTGPSDDILRKLIAHHCKIAVKRVSLGTSDSYINGIENGEVEL